MTINFQRVTGYPPVKLESFDEVTSPDHRRRSLFEHIANKIPLLSRLFPESDHNTVLRVKFLPPQEAHRIPRRTRRPTLFLEDHPLLPCDAISKILESLSPCMESVWKMDDNAPIAATEKGSHG